MNKNYIILPTYNDWKSLNKVLITLNKTHINSFKKTSVLVVNDCSDIKFKFNKKKFNKINSFKILNLKKNVGSQKSIFIALKYLQKRLGRKNNKCIISILDSDGEDDPYKLKKLTLEAFPNKFKALTSCQLGVFVSSFSFNIFFNFMIISLLFYIHQLLTF